MARTYEKGGIIYVSSAWHNIERALLEKEIKKISDGYIHAVDCGTGHQIRMGMNCGATGEITAENAEKFAEAVMKAAKLVREYKYNGYVIDYEKTFDRLPVSEQEEIRAIVKANRA